jgi:hypothetical protein
MDVMDTKNQIRIVEDTGAILPGAMGMTRKALAMTATATSRATRKVRKHPRRSTAAQVRRGEVFTFGVDLRGWGLVSVPPTG